MKKSFTARFFYGVFCLTFIVLLTACSAKKEQKISISGAFALYPLMVTWADEYQKINPDVKIDVTAGGAGKGMSDALSGAVDIGMISREIKDEEISQGAFGVAVTKDAVFPVISSDNPYLDKITSQGLSQEVLAKIFITEEIKTWGEALGDPSITDEIHVYTRTDSAGAAEMWSKFLGGTAQEDLKGIGISGDPGLLDAVIKDQLGIGYNNLNYAFDITTKVPVKGAVVLPIDLNGNGQADTTEYLETKDEAVAAVLSGDYPSPPARVLNLATKGAPTGIVHDFILWILTDGQQYVDAAGYIQLESSQLSSEIEKIGK